MKYKLIIGLGNPGAEYEDTYHNVGLLALDVFSRYYGKWEDNVTLPKFRKHNRLFEYAKMEEGAILMRPLVFMNESGLAAHAAADAFHVKPEEILVLHDDSDLTIGEYKITSGQNAAGHHGIESIIKALGSNEFYRARIGIREKDELRRKKAGDFVLKKIGKEDRKTLDGVCTRIKEEIESSLTP